eukprot:15151-Heterococcus_DN1.PRE.2
MHQAVSKKMSNSARSGASNFEKIFCDLLSALYLRCRQHLAMGMALICSQAHGKGFYASESA